MILDRLKRVSGVQLIASASGCLLLAAVRIYFAISLYTPWRMETTGAEDQALYTLWKFTQGQTLYTDVHVLPFDDTTYNWIFYEIYGTVVTAVLRVLHLDVAWIPNIGRILTLVVTLTGSALFYATARLIEPNEARSSRTILVAISVIAFVNPLTGFWIMTCRPDLLALVFELAGLGFFLRFLKNDNWVWLALAGLGFYAGWACKQTALTALAGSCVTLFLLGHWKPLGVLVAGWGLLVATTLLAMGPTYRACLFAQAHMGYDVGIGFHWLLTAFLKMPFMAVILLGMLRIIPEWRSLRKSPVESAVFLTAGTGFVLELFAVCKNGSADYYFIPAAVWLLLCAVAIWPRFPMGWRASSLIIASGVILAGIAFVFVGGQGQLDRRGSHRPSLALSERLKTLPAPVIVVGDVYDNLPWAQERPPYLIGSWRPEAFQLMAQGYFKTVVVPVKLTLPREGVGVYRQVAEDGAFRYYGRTAAP